MELSFLDLKEREIINVFDGKKLGRIIDIVFNSETGIVRGIVVPGDKKIFKRDEDIFVPIEKIKRIGNDVILVGLQHENRLIKSRSNRDYDRNIKIYENYFNRNLQSQNRRYFDDMNINNYNSNKNPNFKNNVKNANFNTNFQENLTKNAENIPKSYIRVRPISRNKYK